jgi:hypothetical protein
MEHQLMEQENGSNFVDFGMMGGKRRLQPTSTNDNGPKARDCTKWVYLHHGKHDATQSGN